MTSKTTIRQTSPIIDRYLRELEDRTRHLPEDERAEILSSVEDHIADELADLTNPSKADVRHALDAIGPVDSIVEQTPAADVPASPSNTWERVLAVVIGIAALLFGVVPIVGGLLGIVAVVWGLLLRRRDHNSRAWVATVILGSVGIIVQIVMLMGLVAWTTTTTVPGESSVSTVVAPGSSPATPNHH